MNDNAMNPFGAIAARPQQQTAVAASDGQRAVAEVQAAMMIAKMNPRDPIAAMDRILNACARPTLANAAVYTYARGGSDISGPSIRLAEAMAQQWGNIKTSIRELDQSNGVSTVQTIAWDLETGYSVDKVFHVPHERHTKSGAKKLTDPRDIYELVANQGSRRLRACILAVIPGDVTEAAVAQCEVTMKSNADTSPEAMQKLVAAFEPFGVSKEQIEKRIQRRMDAIQPAQVVSLRKLYASLRDGMSAPSDWFEVETEGEQQKTTTLHDIKASSGKKAKPQRDEQDEALQALEKVGKADTGPGVTFASVAEAIAHAETDDALQTAADLIGSVPDAGDREALGKRYKAKRDEMGV